MTTPCSVLTPDETRCRKPAIGIDYDKGEPVCAFHLAAYLSRLEAGGGMAQAEKEESAEVLISLKRLAYHASEFQREAQILDETDTTSDRNLTVSLQLARAAIVLAEKRHDCPACPPAGAPRHSEMMADAQQESAHAERNPQGQ